MKLEALSFTCGHTPIIRPIFKQLSLFHLSSLSKQTFSHSQFRSFLSPLKFSALTNPIRRGRLVHKLSCAGGPSQELVGETLETATQYDHEVIQSISLQNEEDIVVESVDSSGGDDLVKQSIWNQIIEIVKFSGPATGLWLCGPLMSLIDTAIIGQASSIELAALGPGTVLCDNMSYAFMFLSIATSNIVATSLARQDLKEVQRQISILLFVGVTCGSLMLLFTKYLGTWALTAFTGANNMRLLPAANTYVQIRGLAWPSLLVGWVAQSASLGMKDSWGPLKALAAASVVNLTGDIILCSVLGYGIAGAAWATTVSQIIAGFMMIDNLNKKGYNAFAISVPSPQELLQIFVLATPVFITIASKVAFYTLLVYCATSMGTSTVAAHQVMLQTLILFAVWGEPLSQTAQSFMPELIYGVNQSLAKARMLLKSLLVIGASMGLILGTVGTLIPWLFPNIFTRDPEIIGEMHKVLIPYFMVIAIAPSTQSCEGSLLAGRDLRFISSSMTGCFAFCSLLALIMSSQGLGLLGCWCALVGFQWMRFFVAVRRLLSPDGVLFSEDLGRYEFAKPKATVLESSQLS